MVDQKKIPNGNQITHEEIPKYLFLFDYTLNFIIVIIW